MKDESPRGKKNTALRRVITENLRIQRGGAKPPPYIDVAHVVDDVCAKQNHAIFARRGCGKTLLLHDSNDHLDDTIKVVYLNCEDFKRHSFPNTLIEILDALFAEMEKHLTDWFGKRKQTRLLIQNIRKELAHKRAAADAQEEDIRHTSSADVEKSVELGGGISGKKLKADGKSHFGQKTREETQRTFKILSSKIQDLDTWLPRLKEQVREFFEVSTSVKAIFLQLDDLYHLKRATQPFVVDYIHRLCKDVPLYFKVATLRHASTLYSDREGQPIGAQERHDYQPIDIDYTFADFKRTRDQNRKIFHEFARMVDMAPAEADDLFKGEGFERLVMAGGGVPRDTLSLFLGALSAVQSAGDERIGKDDVRTLSRSNFERRTGHVDARNLRHS